MITKLPDKWRTACYQYFNNSSSVAPPAPTQCADELEAALPKWTRITDDPETWPEDGQWIYIGIVGGDCAAGLHEWGNATEDDFLNQRYTTDGPDLVFAWRPLCDLDFPPEDV